MSQGSSIAKISLHPFVLLSPTKNSREDRQIEAKEIFEIKSYNGIQDVTDCVDCAFVSISYINCRNMKNWCLNDSTR